MLSSAFSGFSVGYCINREKVICYHLEFGRFDWMSQSSSGRKWKKCETTLLFIAMHYRGHASLEVKGRWGLLLPPCLLITVQQPGTCSPPSWFKCSSAGIIWMCRASFTSSSCPLLRSSTVVSSQWIGWWFSHTCSATTVLDHGRGQEMLVKEALHIQMIPAEECFNWDRGLVAGLLWSEGSEGETILTDFWLPMTCILSSAWL